MKISCSTVEDRAIGTWAPAEIFSGGGKFFTIVTKFFSSKSLKNVILEFKDRPTGIFQRGFLCKFLSFILCIIFNMNSFLRNLLKIKKQIYVKK